MILVTHVQFMLDYLLHLSYFEPIMHYMVVWQFFLSNYFFSQNKSESSLNFVCFQSDINSGGPGLSILLDSTSSESSERCLRHPQFKLWVLQSDYSTQLWVWQSDYSIHLWVVQSDYGTKRRHHQICIGIIQDLQVSVLVVTSFRRLSVLVVTPFE